MADKSFDFGALLKKHAKKMHKSKPVQFSTVGGGVKKRLENSLSCRRSTRCTLFDRARDLSPACSPQAPALSEAQLKSMQRQQRLQKWKEEKEKQKKELASKKKKPFLPAGVPHNTRQFIPPPPPKTVPSTSGRVTRSQAARNKNKNNQPTTSFAPQNAGFKAPEIRNVTKVPKLAPPKKSKKISVIFEPKLPPVKEVKQTRSNASKQPVMATMSSRGTIKTKAPPLSNTAAASTSSSDYDNMQSTDDETSKSLLFFGNSSKSQSSSGSELEKSRTFLKSPKANSKYKTPKITSRVSIEKSSKTLQSSSSSELEGSPTLLTQNVSKKSSTSKFKTPQKLNTPRRSKRLSLQNEVASTPKNPVPKSESSSEERLRLSKSPGQVSNRLQAPSQGRTPMTPEQIAEEAKRISPFVTVSRGKENARRETKLKLEQGLLADDANDLTSVGHFRLQLAGEVERLSAIAAHWDLVAQAPLPEYVLEEILAATGQARLLVSQKLAQFGALIQRCERSEGAGPPVTAADLHGFWDLVFMQIENIDVRFKKLEEMQRRGWSLEAAPVPARPRPRRAPAPAPAPARRRAGPSALREAIAAARRAKQASAPEPPSEAPVRSFEAGFFTVRSPVRAASPRTPATPRDTLLKTVLSSEAKKASAIKECASFAMLRASVLARHMDCDGVAPLPPTPVSSVDLTATPGRSILKQPSDMSYIRPVKTVLFEKEESDSDTNNVSDPPNSQSDPANDLSDPANDLSDPANDLSDPPDSLLDPDNNLLDPANDLLDLTNKLSDPVNDDSASTNDPSNPTNNASDQTKDLSDDTKDLSDYKLSDRTNNLGAYDISDDPKDDTNEDQPTHNKENRKKHKLVRQEAMSLIEYSPVQTRNRRKTLATPQTEGKKTQRRKKVLEDKDVTEEAITPRRSMRNRKSCPQQ